MLGAWCRSHACPKGSFKASPPQSSHMPSVTHACVARTHCMYTACTVWALPLHCLCAALTLPVRCMCAACAPHACCHCAAMRAACALPCALPVRCHARCLCAAMRAACVLPCALPVRCLYIRLWATCTSLSSCPVFPLHVFALPCPQGLGGVRPWHGLGPPFSLRTCSPFKEHYKPFSEFLEETSKWLRRYNRIFT